MIRGAASNGEKPPHVVCVCSWYPLLPSPVNRQTHTTERLKWQTFHAIVEVLDQACGNGATIVQSLISASRIETRHGHHGWILVRCWSDINKESNNECTRAVLSARHLYTACHCHSEEDAVREPYAETAAGIEEIPGGGGAALLFLLFFVALRRLGTIVSGCEHAKGNIAAF